MCIYIYVHINVYIYIYQHSARCYSRSPSLARDKSSSRTIRVDRATYRSRFFGNTSQRNHASLPNVVGGPSSRPYTGRRVPATKPAEPSNALRYVPKALHKNWKTRMRAGKWERSKKRWKKSMVTCEAVALKPWVLKPRRDTASARLLLERTYSQNREASKANKAVWIRAAKRSNSRDADRPRINAMSAATLSMYQNPRR